MACGDEGNYVHDLEITDFQGHSTTPVVCSTKKLQAVMLKGVSLIIRGAVYSLMVGQQYPFKKGAGCELHRVKPFFARYLRAKNSRKRLKLSPVIN